MNINFGDYQEPTPGITCRQNLRVFVEGPNLIILNEKKGDKEVIPIDKIQSFSVKDGTKLSDGTFAFSTAQAATGSIHLGWGVSIASGAEKSYHYSYKENMFARELQNYLSNFQQQSAVSAVPAQNSSVVAVADELRNLKSLLDDGIITQSEFDAKKKQLLGI